MFNGECKARGNYYGRHYKLIDNKIISLFHRRFLTFNSYSHLRSSEISDVAQASGAAVDDVPHLGDVVGKGVHHQFSRSIGV